VVKAMIRDFISIRREVFAATVVLSMIALTSTCILFDISKVHDGSDGKGTVRVREMNPINIALFDTPLMMYAFYGIMWAIYGTIIELSKGRGRWLVGIFNIGVFLFMLFDAMWDGLTLGYVLHVVR